MRKVIMLNRISIDGFYCGPNGEIDWFIHEAEVDKAAHEMMTADTLLMGRLTYQMFESYWPQVLNDPHASPEALATANELKEMRKVVFSTTLNEVTWDNSELYNTDVAAEVGKLKQGNGADITIFGSGSIVQQLEENGLVDEYLLVITPVILGAGKPLFKDVPHSNLHLLAARNFSSGNILLHYRR
ncbi:MAG: dihydrofolate reductase [Anaerolineae bacterium]|nr:dihydrofolate reductase [Anaerolineae bacterium]